MERENDAPEVLTVAEVAAMLRTKEDTIARALRRGDLPGVYLGTREGWRIYKTDALNWRTNVPSQRKEAEA